MRVLPGLPKRVVLAGALSIVALGLYALGARFFLPLVLLGVNVVCLPMPKVLRSWFSRFVASFVLMLSLLQVAAAVQFLVFPKSGFLVMGVLAALFEVLLVWWAPGTDRKRPLFTKNDLLAFAVVAVFLLPFAPIFSGHRSIERIAQIGGIQAIDATNHYAYIAESTEAQHYTYTPGNYYPRGFHIAVGFVQHSFFNSQDSLSWQNNAILFFAQYVVLGATLGYALYILCIQWLEQLIKRSRLGGAKVLACAALAPPLALFFLIPFVPEGFLSYYYSCITVVFGAIVLTELSGALRKNDDAVNLSEGGRDQRWWIVLALLFVFGAVSSWPLLLPPLVVSVLLFVVPKDWRRVAFWRSLWDVRILPVAVAVVLQFVPLYFQFAYGSVDGSQGINAQGGLRAFHPLVLAGGMLLVAFVVFSARFAGAQRRLVFNLFMPFATFVGGLTLLQYFSLGEVRYYVMKSSMLLEMLLLVLAVVLLVLTYAQSEWRGIKYGVFVAAVPLVAMLLLVSTMANPLKDDRDLFRSVSGQEKPLYFDQDVRVYTHLALQGKVAHFNSTLVHYNADQGKYFAHMQIPYWMNMMQYNGKKDDLSSLRCAGRQYTNMAFGNFTPPEQEAFVRLVHTCAQLAHQHGQEYYIVTDKDSAPQVRRTFGSDVKVVYQ
jgi:hypothetical protein